MRWGKGLASLRAHGYPVSSIRSTCTHVMNGLSVRIVVLMKVRKREREWNGMG